jgi:hypothetical protein
MWYMFVLTGEQGAVVWLGCLLLVFKAVNASPFELIAAIVASKRSASFFF